MTCDHTRHEDGYGYHYVLGIGWCQGEACEEGGVSGTHYTGLDWPDDMGEAKDALIEDLKLVERELQQARRGFAWGHSEAFAALARVAAGIMQLRKDKDEGVQIGGMMLADLRRKMRSLTDKDFVVLPFGTYDEQVAFEKGVLAVQEAISEVLGGT